MRAEFQNFQLDSKWFKIRFPDLNHIKKHAKRERRISVYKSFEKVAFILFFCNRYENNATTNKLTIHCCQKLLFLHTVMFCENQFYIPSKSSMPLFPLVLIFGRLIYVKKLSFCLFLFFTSADLRRFASNRRCVPDFLYRIFSYSYASFYKTIQNPPLYRENDFIFMWLEQNM